jgi:hypothetical protein
MISKVLANRLKVVLPEIISINQSTFILGRLITDNILTTYETMHSMQTRMWSKASFMGIKLDMSKAYDRVECDFLEAVMGRLGFADWWIRLVMICVYSVSYAVVVNGNLVGHIKPTRGIRQGDPLSPHLFLICAKALSSLLYQVERIGSITGVPSYLEKGAKIKSHFLCRR